MSTHHEGVQHLANKAKTARKTGRHARMRNANVYVIKQKSSLLAQYILITQKRKRKTDEWTADMKKENEDKNFKLDTGAQVMVLSFTLLEKAEENRDIERSESQAATSTGQRTAVRGKSIMQMKPREKVHELTFTVVERKVTPILGLKVCE